MAKNVAVLAVDPVNGMGLFQYLEAFYENKIPFRVFAVAESKRIHTNSGVALEADATIADLRGHEAEYDAVVFACGDAVPVFAEHAGEPHNVRLMEALDAFGAAGKILAGHCGAGLFFDRAGVASGKRLAVHPYVEGAISQGIAAGKDREVDGTLFTARDEHHIAGLLPDLLRALA